MHRPAFEGPEVSIENPTYWPLHHFRPFSDQIVQSRQLMLGWKADYPLLESYLDPYGNQPFHFCRNAVLKANPTEVSEKSK